MPAQSLETPDCSAMNLSTLPPTMSPIVLLPPPPPSPLQQHNPPYRYPSPVLLGQPHRLSEGETSYPRPGSFCSPMSGSGLEPGEPSWRTPVMMAASPSSASSVIANSYDSFSDFESLIPPPYESGPSPAASSHGPVAPSSPDPQGIAKLIHSPSPFPSLPDGSFDCQPLGSARQDRLRPHTPGLFPNEEIPRRRPSRPIQTALVSDQASYFAGPTEFLNDSRQLPWLGRFASGPHGESISEETMSLIYGSKSRSDRPRKAPRRLTTKEDANFQCEVKGCGKLFSRSYNFKAHMETHDEKREYPFPCLEKGCTKKFVRKTDLHRHHQSVHTKERHHKCDYCGRLFARKDTLRR